MDEVYFMKLLIENWRRFITEVETGDKEDDEYQNKVRNSYDDALDEKKNEDGKEQGADGKACWKGKKYAGQDKDGSDICVPMEEELDEKVDKDSMPCNKPRRTSSHKGKSHVVKACENGKEKIIPFGEKGASTAGKPKKVKAIK